MMHWSTGIQCLQSHRMNSKVVLLLAQVPEAECVVFDNDKVRRPIPDDKAIKIAVEAIKVRARVTLPGGW